MSSFKNTEELIYNGRYIDALEALHITKEAVWKGLGCKTYDFLAIQNKIAVVLSKQGYYDEALNIFSDIDKKLAEFGNKYDQEIMAVKENIGKVFADRRHYDHALKIFEEIYKYRCLTLGLDNPLTFQALRNVAVTLSSAGRYNEALIGLTQVHKYRLYKFGIDHKSSFESSNDIATVYLKQHEYDKALWIFEKTHKFLEQKHPQGWDTLLARCDTANIYKIQHRYEEAFKIFGEVYLIQSKINPLHPDTLSTLRHLAVLFEIQGEYKTALLLLNKIYSVRSLECPIHPDTIEVEKQIASILLKQEKVSSALHFFNSVLSKIYVVYGTIHEAAVEISREIALELYTKKTFGESLKIFKAIFNTQCKMQYLGPNHPDTLLTKIYIGRISLYLSDFSEAVEAFKDVLEIVKTVLDPNDADCIVASKNIAEIYKLQKKFDKAYDIHYDFFQTQLLTMGEEHSNTSKARQNLEEFLNSIPKSSLVKAVFDNDFNEVKFVVEIQDVDINARDPTGCTALHISSERGNTEIVKYLLGKGAFHNVKNKDGKIPMDLAANEEIKCIFQSVDALFVALKEGNFQDIFQVVKENNHLSFTPEMKTEILRFT